MSDKIGSYLKKLFGLEEKTAVVTGGNRGIGQVVARGLADAGAIVYILSRSAADETLEMIRGDGNQAFYISTDVTDEKSVDYAIEVIEKNHKHVDIVFNNAGICIHKSTFEASIEEFRKVVDVNLTGEYIVARSAAKSMVKNGNCGSIINMASMSGTIVNIPQWQASYNASKAGVIHMTKSLALEWIPYGIRVNSLSPGYISTPMSVDTPQELKDAWKKMMPYGRMGTPEELVGAVLYLASNASGYTTGSDLIIDGAYVCQ